MGGHTIGGHTDLSHVKMPDYKNYKVSKEHTPELYAYQERLAREGLKDPWIRNLVWRYEKPAPFFTRNSSFIVGAVIGLIGFAGLVYADRNLEMQWHTPKEEKYKLLYQLKTEGNQKAHH